MLEAAAKKNQVFRLLNRWQLHERPWQRCRRYEMSITTGGYVGFYPLQNVSRLLLGRTGHHFEVMSESKYVT